ncbi:MAG: hypothetical protein ICV79_24610, partial [Flavisolibacter sp.]|nr:hypothetical protein [Flavisolibacter sp.]
MNLKSVLSFKYFVWYIFLLPLFFILHGYNENFGLIPISEIVTLSIKYALVTFVVFIVSNLLFNDIKKAVVFSVILLCIYFFFGAFHDFLKRYIPSGFFISYKFLLLLIFLIIISGIILIKRARRDFTEIARYVKYTLSVLILLEVGTTGYYLITGKAGKNNIAPDKIKLASVSSCAATKPDIFFIVFDEYTSSKGLQEDFNFSNHYLDSLLREHRFFISADSKSNYNSTPFSIASTLNFDYLMSGSEGEVLTAKKFLQAERAVKENRLTPFLKQQGYLLKNYGCMDLNDASAQTKPYFNEVVTNLIDGQTITSRIRRDIWWRFTTRDLFTGTFRVPGYYKKEKRDHLYRNRFNWSQLQNEL